MEQHPQGSTKVMSLQILRPMHDFLQTHLQEPEILFLVHEWPVLEEIRLVLSRLQCEFLWGDLQAKVVPETDYLSRFLRSQARVPQASLQADSTLTRCQEQKPQDPRRTRWPQEKGRWAISPDSCASHPLHSYADGYYGQWRYDDPWDWLQEACHMARVHWGAHCKGFRSKEGLHYWMERSVRNQLEGDQVQRVLEKLSGGCLQTSNNQPYSRGWKSLGDSSPGLYCIDLAEAYVMQENVSLRI